MSERDSSSTNSSQDANMSKMEENVQLLEFMVPEASVESNSSQQSLFSFQRLLNDESWDPYSDEHTAIWDRYVESLYNSHERPSTTLIPAQTNPDATYQGGMSHSNNWEVEAFLEEPLDLTPLDWASYDRLSNPMLRSEWGSTEEEPIPAIPIRQIPPEYIPDQDIEPVETHQGSNSESQDDYPQLYNYDGSLVDSSTLADALLLYEFGRSQDVYENMRMDVDDMSYEEIIVLEEHIGNVDIGLSEEAIEENIGRRRLSRCSPAGPADEDPCCCICLEEYEDGDDIGILNCGHEFHFRCIKEWLRVNNSCPICKRAGLSLEEQDQ